MQLTEKANLFKAAFYYHVCYIGMSHKTTLTNIQGQTLFSFAMYYCQMDKTVTFKKTQLGFLCLCMPLSYPLSKRVHLHRCHKGFLNSVLLRQKTKYCGFSVNFVPQTS